MRIYIDADACPVKDEIYRVAARHRLPVTVVAAGFIRVPQDPLIERVAAGADMDAADDWIAERVGPGDIVITADIPLASRCVKAGAEAIAPERAAVHRAGDRNDPRGAQPDARPALGRRGDARAAAVLAADRSGLSVRARCRRSGACSARTSRDGDERAWRLPSFSSRTSR